jgi:hypothetical protein
MPAFPERLQEGIEILDGEYVVLPEYKSAGALIAEVCHVHRNGVGGKVVTPVGRLSAFIYSGEEAEDLFKPHWSIHLFIRSDGGWRPAGRHAGSNDCCQSFSFELWIGDAAQIQSKRVRKQKTDRQDAQLIVKLMLKDDFPQIWVPSWENRDLRQLLWHRHRLVQERTRIMNQLQAIALNEGLRCKKRLWREPGRQQLESFPLAP